MSREAGMRPVCILASAALAATAIVAAACVAAACVAGPRLLSSRRNGGHTPVAASGAGDGGVSDASASSSLEPVASGHSGAPVLHSVATTPAALREVLRYCNAAGPVQASELRAAAFASPDPLVAGNAARALGRVGALAGDPGTARLLSDPRLRVRQDAVIGLGLGGDPAALDELEPLLECGDPAVRPLVIQAIGRIGGPRAERLLRLKLGDDCTTVVERAFAAEALRGAR